MKNFFSLSVIVFLFTLKTADAQTILQWAYHFGSDNDYTTDEAFNVATDNENNVYVTGYFNDSVDFDPGPGEATWFFSSGTYHPAAFLAKYTPAGEFLWVIPVGSGSGGVSGKSVTFDSEGNVIWTGTVNGTADFDPGPANHTFGGSVSYNAAFVAKYNSDGAYLNAFAIWGNSSCTGKQVLTDADDNILLIGSFQGPIDFDPSSADYSITAVNNYGDLFFAKYSPDGVFLFVKNINASPSNDNFDYGDFTAYDGAGNIYVAGKFEGTTDFDPGSGVVELTATSTDVFFAKYDGDINLQWAKQLAGDDQAVCHALALDDAGNIYLTGWFRTEIDMDPGSGISLVGTGSNSTSDDIFIGKYTNAGELMWAHAFAGEGYDYARNILADDDGNVYVSGDFYYELDFDPGPGQKILSSPLDGQDAFIAVYDHDGNYLSASQIKGESSSEVRGMGMQLDNADDILLAGWFSLTADFDCTNGTYSLTSGGDYDIYVAKYDSVIFSTVGIHETSGAQFTIVPNPTNEFFVINQLPIQDPHAEMYVTDLTGRVVLTILTNELFDAGNQNLEVNTSSLISSTYFLVIKTSEKILTQKFIVQHSTQ